MLEWIATILSIVGILLNAKKNMWCWPVWFTSNIFWIIVSVMSNNIPQIALWVTFAVFNGYGYWQWNKESKHPQR